MIGQRTRAPKSSEGKMVSGKETLRLRSKGTATVQEVVSYWSGCHGNKKTLQISVKSFLPIFSFISFPVSPVSLRRKPLRRSMTFWRATWAYGILNLVRRAFALMCHILFIITSYLLYNDLKQPKLIESSLRALIINKQRISMSRSHVHFYDFQEKSFF